MKNPENFHPPLASKEFYYTFGSSEQFPHYGGWVIIHAIDRADADAIFRYLYPHPNDDELLNAAMVYTKEQFSATAMAEKGTNMGHSCYNTIWTPKAIIAEREQLQNTLKSNAPTPIDEDKKLLHLTVQCMATYESDLPVPKNLNLKEAIQYALDHTKEIPITPLTYVEDSDEIDTESARFV